MALVEIGPEYFTARRVGVAVATVRVSDPAGQPRRDVAAHQQLHTTRMAAERVRPACIGAAQLEGSIGETPRLDPWYRKNIPLAPIEPRGLRRDIPRQLLRGANVKVPRCFRFERRAAATQAGDLLEMGELPIESRTHTKLETLGHANIDGCPRRARR